MAKPSRKCEIPELTVVIEVIVDDTFDDTPDDTPELVVAAPVVATSIVDVCWSQKFFECFYLINWMSLTVLKVVYMVLIITLFT